MRYSKMTTEGVIKDILKKGAEKVGGFISSKLSKMDVPKEGEYIWIFPWPAHIEDRVTSVKSARSKGFPVSNGYVVSRTPDTYEFVLNAVKKVTGFSEGDVVRVEKDHSYDRVFATIESISGKEVTLKLLNSKDNPWPEEYNKSEEDYYSRMKKKDAVVAKDPYDISNYGLSESTRGKRMKKLRITKEHFNRSKYFTRKYGRLTHVSESGKLFRTSKGNVLEFMKESETVDIRDIEREYGVGVARCLQDYCKEKEKSLDKVINDITEDIYGLTQWDWFEKWAKKRGVDVYDKFSKYDGLKDLGKEDKLVEPREEKRPARKMRKSRRGRI